MWTDRLSGQTNQRGAQDQRDPYERDRTRVIHCPAFRRLQRKTQILRTDEGDFHRTRLTHSLEVDSIGRSIVHHLKRTANHLPLLSSLLPPDDLVSVICLLHDIGHPPFGHGGEVALNYMMRAHGGFEGNGQTLRLLTKVESSYGPYGLDLTRRALLGILKYPVKRSLLAAPEEPVIHDSIHRTIRMNDWLPPKAYFDCEAPEVSWLLEVFSEQDKFLFQTLAKQPLATQVGTSAYYSFDCSVMDIADDIAYGVHDLEDAIHLKFIHREDLDVAEFESILSHTSLSRQKDDLLQALFSNDLCLRKQAIGEMVNYFITATMVSETNEIFEDALLKYNLDLRPEASALLNHLKDCVYRQVIDSQEARTFEYGAQSVVLRLFEAISSDPLSLLDTKNRGLFQKVEDETSAYRCICDYVANMTDEYAYRVHERLFGLSTRAVL